jgi:hypothetical protein
LSPTTERKLGERRFVSIDLFGGFLITAISALLSP